MKKIIKQLKKLDNFAVFTHVSPDGDAIGSLFSLCYILKKMGKKVDAFVSGEVPKRLQFMADDFGENYKTEITENDYQCCISVDCADDTRLGIFKDMYYKAPVTICIDHHVTNKGYAMYNFICKDASSNGEILFEIFHKLKVLDGISASLVYGAIASDTGCFGFSNTSSKTHRFAAKLIDYGADFEKYNQKLFFTNTKSSLRAQIYTLQNMEYYFNDRVALATVNDKTLEEIGATREDSEGLVNLLKDIEGVDVAILFKEFDDRVKVSFRTSEVVDATVIAVKFGGGGHSRAAGCTIYKPLADAKSTVLKTLEEFF